MPLYVVRWPGLRASLISARDEADLMDQIDEVDSPGECTWRRYNGPLWLNFRMRAEYRVVAKCGGRLRSDEIVIQHVADDFSDQPLVVSPLGDNSGEAALEMRDAVLRGAFPSVAKVLEDGEEGAEADETASAIVADIASHAEDVRFKSTTFGPGPGLTLVRTDTWAFMFGKGAPTEISPLLFEDFCYGLAPIAPNRDGLVRVAEVRVYLERGRPVAADVGKGLALRTDVDGWIHKAHKADAFDKDQDENSPTRRFEARRNSAVLWSLSQKEIRQLRAAVNRKARRPIFTGYREQ
ncbi:MAG: hypothetical protein ACOY0T_31030 [Myxococcota bacterium]